MCVRGGELWAKENSYVLCVINLFLCSSHEREITRERNDGFLVGGLLLVQPIFLCYCIIHNKQQRHHHHQRE